MTGVGIGELITVFVSGMAPFMGVMTESLPIQKRSDRESIVTGFIVARNHFTDEIFQDGPPQANIEKLHWKNGELQRSS
jgi:hypothetical protein